MRKYRLVLAPNKTGEDNDGETGKKSCWFCPEQDDGVKILERIQLGSYEVGTRDGS